MSRVIQEVGRFDIAVEDTVFVDMGEGSEQTPEVQAHIADFHISEILSEVPVLEVWENGNDLVLVSEGGDEWAHGITISEVMEEIEFVKDSNGTAGDVDLLDSDISRSGFAGLFPACGRGPF